jgi:hypothetical protein
MKKQSLRDKNWHDAFERDMKQEVVKESLIGDVNSDEIGSGARYNSGKTKYDLIPIHLLKDACDVFDFGSKKYSAFNWAKGMPWSVPYASMMRHMQAWYRGEQNDAESGLPHLAHAMCNLIMLTHYASYYKDGDDRPMKWFGGGE